MKLVIQRVSFASVSVDKKVVGQIEKGLFILVGVGKEDKPKIADSLAEKLVKMRLMKDTNDKMNLSIKDVKGEILIVSQFTLYSETTGGNRPSFISAAQPDLAREVYNRFQEYPTQDAWG